MGIDYEKYKKILLDMRNEIIEDMEKAGMKVEEPVENGPGDLLDLASRERDRDISMYLCDRDREKLAEIEEALERIEEGVYGICEECGNEISPERLEVMPFARLCVDCQSKKEEREKTIAKREEGLVYRNIDQEIIFEEEEGD